jgi:hypothetical protein
VLGQFFVPFFVGFEIEEELKNWTCYLFVFYIIYFFKYKICIMNIIYIFKYKRLTAVLYIPKDLITKNHEFP